MVVAYSNIIQYVYTDQSYGIANVSVSGIITPLTLGFATSQFVSSYNAASGVFGTSQPAFTDITGIAAPAQLPIFVGGTASLPGIVGAVPAPAPGLAPLAFLSANGQWLVPAGTGIGLSSVGLSTNAPWLTVGNSPLVVNGTISLNATTGLTQNQVLATPNGSSGVVGLRSLVTADLPAGTGTVTSVALTSPGVVYTVTGSPITTSGTFALSLVAQVANTVFAGPTSGGSVNPTFRALVAADIPSLSSIYLPLAGGTVTGALSLSTTLAMTAVPANGVRFTPNTNTSGIVTLYGTNSGNSVTTWSIDQLGNINTTGSVTAAEVTAPVAVNTQNASYIAALSDADQLIYLNVAGANTLTIPPNSSVAFPVGTTLTVEQAGAGQCTVTAGAGVTLHNSSSNNTRAQYSLVSAVQTAANQWTVFGDTQ
jgi:hypothetical protein